jgi:hypothetical protein
MAKVYVATKSDHNALAARVTAVEDADPVVNNIYVQQTDPAPVPVNSIWFQTNSSGDIISMFVMVP